ncbi:hypothetical protein BJ138DRAFT_1150266 [Hygrophoropsis aurantiaca]|uniref:Uncharacterized protein n=1 Tax=Hygrophoropsis aurantiaca TaxID=72124 RepID=A0ACB8AE39_9AGAM|nr:hypothetical protein BJ138DRAFT_1150266 [Hygrophoropsis aurantiaca]
MAQRFFSKLVKTSPASPTNNGTGPVKDDRNTESPRTSTVGRPHSQTISHPPSVAYSAHGANSPDSLSTRGSVKIGVIPPSPRVFDSDLLGFAEAQSQDNGYGETLQHKRARSQDRTIPDRHAISLAARPASAMSLIEDTLPTPVPGRSTRPDDWHASSANSSPRSRQLTPASSTGNLRGFVSKRDSRTPPLPESNQVSRKSSKQSIRSQTQPPPPLKIEQVSPSQPRRSSDGRRNHEVGTVPPKGLVESPTSVGRPTGAHSSEHLSARADTDALSITSNGSKKTKWRRPSVSTPTRKSSGVASALAASGMAMAHPATSQVPPMPALPASASKVALNGKPKETVNGRTKVQHAASSSVHSMPSSSGVQAGRSRQVSVTKSDISDGQYQTDTFGSTDESSGSDDELDLDEDDIPVTGFAVASNKRNADFHELFPAIPEGDYLIEDYGCALQREILIQGRIYISENHICFHANIFGWITDLSIPIYEITALEKKMTAFVIPNAIMITTRQAKYTFASFLSRDTTYDVIANIWRLARPDDNLEFGAADSRNTSSQNVVSTNGSSLPSTKEGAVNATPAAANKVTQCTCSSNSGHLNETALETVLPGTPDKIYNLMFASGFIKDFMRVDQRLIDVQISDWSPTSEGSKLLTRNMSYIKPLNNSVGPKQTKCEIHDENLICDFDDHVIMLTTTRTPDVPSGGVFAVKTRTCLMWASSISTRVIVTTQVDWTGRSFIKGLIEKSAIEGQKVYHSDLDKAMRMYIQEHQSEFIPAGVDPTAVAPAEPISPSAESPVGHALNATMSDEVARKVREHERNRRGLQWAYDTFDGAYNVAKRSTIGALELIKDGWEQSSTTTILYFVITILVLSNLWTFILVGRREEAGRRKEAKRIEEREKWVQGVVTGLWEEMASGRVRAGASSALPTGFVAEDWRSEIESIGKTLDAVEERVQRIRETLNALD